MLIQFDTPKNLNGEELVAELTKIGVQVTGRPQIDENKDLWLNINELDKTKATLVVAAHNSAAKAALLAKLGITADEARLLLGGN